MRADPQELTLQALDALPQAILIVDLDGQICARNTAASNVLPPGDSAQEVLRAAICEPIDWSAEFTALAQGARDRDVLKVGLRDADNGSVPVDVSLRPLGSGEQDGPLGVLVGVQDASARVSVERGSPADEGFSAAEDFAERVAHELNNPLDGVLRYVGLAERSGEAEDVKRYLNCARNGLLRMVKIIRRLLDGAGEGGTRENAVCFEDLLTEALNVMGPRADQLGVRVERDLVGGDRLLISGALFQVFCNVIKNALDAMPDGGLLRVRQRLDGEWCTIEFADTGPGLGEVDPEAIFEPFFTSKPPGEGSGLGLAISRDIVSREGGTIRAAECPEGGVSVVIHLPSDAIEAALRTE